METFSAIARRLERIDNDTLYVEFEPANAELKEKVFHGATLPISGSVPDAISAYEPGAAREMLIAVDRMFPGAYQLDAKYG